MGWERTRVDLSDVGDVDAYVKLTDAGPTRIEFGRSVNTGQRVSLYGQSYRLRNVVDVGGLGETFSAGLRKVTPPKRVTARRRSPAPRTSAQTMEETNEDGGQEEASAEQGEG